jgi:tRNA pseudouridine55 synthase
VVARHDMGDVGLEAVRAAAAGFVGEIDQVPPMVSAVKVGGRRLHELARRGEEVERPARRVVVHRFDVEPTADPGVFRVEVACSSGTYVRSLVADLGAALGGGAHQRGLRRTEVGSFTVAEAIPLAGLDDLDALPASPVLPPAEALRDYPSTVVDGDTAARVAHGGVLDVATLAVEGDGPWAVLDAYGRLLAVYERRLDGRLKPAVVLTGAPGDRR